jgi:hypothetical protein
MFSIFHSFVIWTDSRLLLPFGSKRRRLMNEVNRKTKRTTTAIRRGLDEFFATHSKNPGWQKPLWKKLRKSVRCT